MNLIYAVLLWVTLASLAHAAPDPAWGPSCQQNGGTNACHREFTLSPEWWEHNMWNVTTHFPTEQAAKDGYLKVYSGTGLCHANWVNKGCGEYEFDYGWIRPSVAVHNWSCEYSVSAVYGSACEYKKTENVKISKRIEKTCIGEGFVATANKNDYYCEKENPGEAYFYCPAGKCENLDVGEASCKAVGNPVDSENGNKMQREVDYAAAGQIGLQFIRYYNSAMNVLGGRMGPRWRTNFDRGLISQTLDDGSVRVVAFRHDGKSVFLTAKSQGWYSSATSLTVTTISQNSPVPGAQWMLSDADGNIEYYDASGKLVQLTARSGRVQKLVYDDMSRLQRVDDAYGHTMTFAYDDAGRIRTFTDPAQNVYTYHYNEMGMLESVDMPGFPDAVTRKYIYDDITSPYRLTGIENEKGVRFATWQYDERGRAYSSEHASGVDKYTLYFQGDSTVITDPLGTQRTYRFKSANGSMRLSGVDQPGGAGCAAASNQVQYDANGNLQSRTDFNGIQTTYVYDLLTNLERSRTEAANTPSARTITTEWHATYRLPIRIAEPNRITTFSYYTNGDLQSVTYQATDDPTGTQAMSARAVGMAVKSLYTYDANRLLKTVREPSVDGKPIKNETYTWTNGNLATVTNGVGHVTTYGDYNAHGLPQTITAPDGTVTRMTYYPRGQVATVVQSAGGQSRWTKYEYEPTGDLSRIQFPDGSVAIYAYDDAQRLISVTDGLGNTVTYTLDNLGNRVEEKVSDADGSVQRRVQRIYDALGRLQATGGGDDVR